MVKRNLNQDHETYPQLHLKLRWLFLKKTIPSSPGIIYFNVFKETDSIYDEIRKRDMLSASYGIIPENLSIDADYFGNDPDALRFKRGDTTVIRETVPNE